MEHWEATKEATEEATTWTPAKTLRNPVHGGKGRL